MTAILGHRVPSSRSVGSRAFGALAFGMVSAMTTWKLPYTPLGWLARVVLGALAVKASSYAAGPSGEVGRWAVLVVGAVIAVVVGRYVDRTVRARAGKPT